MKPLLALFIVLLLSGCGTREMVSFVQEPNILAITQQENVGQTIRDMRTLHGAPRLSDPPRIAYLASYRVRGGSILDAFSNDEDDLEVYYLIIDEMTWIFSVHVERFSPADEPVLVRKTIADIMEQTKQLSRSDLRSRYESMPASHRY